MRVLSLVRAVRPVREAAEDVGGEQVRHADVVLLARLRERAGDLRGVFDRLVRRRGGARAALRGEDRLDDRAVSGLR